MEISNCSALLQPETTRASRKRRCSENVAADPAWSDRLTLWSCAPWIARELLRPGDRSILAELHEATFQELREQFSELQGVELAHSDGFSLLEQTPSPKPGRLLALIDPPYERPDDWQRIVQTLSRVRGGLKTGTFMIWYPIKNDSPIRNFKFELNSLSPERAYEFEFSPFVEDLPERLNGCGVVVLGAPWKFEERIRDLIFPLLQQVLADGVGRVAVGRLGQ